MEREGACRDTQLYHLVKIIFNQRKERHYYYSDTFVEDSRELEGQTFAATGRYKCQNIFTALSCINDLTLVLSEKFITEHFTVDFVDVLVPFERPLPLLSVVFRCFIF